MMFDSNKKKESGFYESYANFARTLRAWMVAYGVGLPTILLSQEHVGNLIRASSQGFTVTCLFLVGVIVQVVATLLYKYSMGYIYASELDPKLESSRIYRVAEWLSEAFWLELLFDLVAIVCFVWGTFLVVAIGLRGTAH